MKALSGITFFRIESGFSYLSVMALVAVIGIFLSVAGYQWKTVIKREKEKELLFRGNQIRSAILQYMNDDPLKRFPHGMEDLIRDPRSPNPKRYLRKIYKDPMTNEAFSLIQDPVRGLVGVHSSSHEKPLKIKNFSTEDICFEDKESYSDWRFEIPPVINAQIAPGNQVAVPGSSAVNPIVQSQNCLTSATPGKP